MKTRFILLLLLVCTSTWLSAQAVHISGKVINADTGEPIAYTSVGVAGKELGTIANTQGEFSFKIPEASIAATDKVIISSIGFEKGELQLKDFKRGEVTIKLKPQAVGLNEVAVRPRKLKAKVLGKNDREFFTSSVYFNRYDVVDDKLGIEIGNIINLNKGCYLNNFNFYVNYNEFKSIKFRLNLYAVKDDLPAESLLKEEILFDMKEEQKGWVQVDLSKYNLQVENLDKVAVTIQWLESEGITEKSKYFSFSTAVSPAHKGIRRSKSEATWETDPIYHSMYFNADCYKQEANDKVGAK